MTVFYISDKVGDRAIAIATGSRPDDPAGALQCVRCGALGTQTDSSRWPTIAGQVATFGIWLSRRLSLTNTETPAQRHHHAARYVAELAGSAVMHDHAAQSKGRDSLAVPQGFRPTFPQHAETEIPQ